MKRLFFANLAMLALTAATGLAQAPNSQPGLTLTSSAFEDGGIIPAKYTMNNPAAVSPLLQWTHVPDGTVTFALILDDPDTALRKSATEVLHWMIFNVPGSSTSLPEGVPNLAQLPDGSIQGKNTRGTPGFMGPGAPPAGPYHHYTFQLFALDTKLALGADATRDDLIAAMSGHILGKGVIVGRFHR